MKLTLGLCFIPVLMLGAGLAVRAYRANRHQRERQQQGFAADNTATPPSSL